MVQCCSVDRSQCKRKSDNGICFTTGRPQRPGSYRVLYTTYSAARAHCQSLSGNYDLCPRDLLEGQSNPCIGVTECSLASFPVWALEETLHRK